ncbi:MAG: galactose-1-phosphate uridylyltransferase [Candidatus Omnitrophota bacterium]
MTELRRDPIVGRWIIVNTSSCKKPQDFKVQPQQYEDAANCPFCYGNEKMTPPEIQAFRDQGSYPNSRGWQVRVIPNKFPALQIEGQLDKCGDGIFDYSNGIGAHEIVIESPQHTQDLADLEPAHIEKILRMFCLRSKDLQNDTRFKYILIFKNYGNAAGASLDHDHAQLIALPMIPKSVLEELKGSASYYEFKERCLFCDIIRQEVSENERIVIQNKEFVVFCPFVSRFPFEMWILPKAHKLFYPDIEATEISSLAKVLKEALLRLKNTLNNSPYNLIIHTAPINGEEWPGYHWHIEIIPRVDRVAGFEWGTGFYIIPTPPELAAKYLREAKI